MKNVSLIPESEIPPHDHLAFANKVDGDLVLIGHDPEGQSLLIMVRGSEYALQLPLLSVAQYIMDHAPEQSQSKSKSEGGEQDGALADSQARRSKAK